MNRMQKQQVIEGKLKGCMGSSCPTPCCDDDHVEEWTNEYFAFHERIKDHLVSLGIKIEFIGDRVRFTNCGDGKECKFLAHSLNKDIDPRPIDCKIYPFAVDWDNIDFEKKIAHLCYWENSEEKYCPLVKSDRLPKEFKWEIGAIIKREFAVLFYGARFTVKFSNRPSKK